MLVSKLFAKAQLWVLNGKLNKFHNLHHKEVFARARERERELGNFSVFLWRNNFKCALETELPNLLSQQTNEGREDLAISLYSYVAVVMCNYNVTTAPKNPPTNHNLHVCLQLFALTAPVGFSLFFFFYIIFFGWVPFRDCVRFRLLPLFTCSVKIAQDCMCCCPENIYIYYIFCSCHLGLYLCVGVCFYLFIFAFFPVLWVTQITLCGVLLSGVIACGWQGLINHKNIIFYVAYQTLTKNRPVGEIFSHSVIWKSSVGQKSGLSWESPLLKSYFRDQRSLKNKE